MQIVIDIPEDNYKRLMEYDGVIDDFWLEAIKAGTPLPKGHGRLIECNPVYDKLMRNYNADKRDYPKLGENYRVGLSQALDLLNNAPTIIEADKE